MSLTVIIVLIVVGFLFLLLEVLVVPGATVVGITGFVLMAVGIWQSYAVYGTPEGHYALVGTVFFSALSLSFALRSNTWKKAMLHTNLTGKVNDQDDDKVIVGDTGKSISRLVPMGKALINNAYYEVRSTGEFIDQGTDIVVSKVERNRIFVKSNK